MVYLLFIECTLNVYNLNEAFLKVLFFSCTFFTTAMLFVVNFNFKFWVFFLRQIIASFYHYSPAILTTAWLLCIFIMGTVGLVYNWTPACLLVAVYMQFFSKSHGGKMKRQQIAWRDSGFWNILGKWMTAWYRRLFFFSMLWIIYVSFPLGLIIAKKIRQESLPWKYINL